MRTYTYHVCAMCIIMNYKIPYTYTRHIAVSFGSYNIIAGKNVLYAVVMQFNWKEGVQTLIEVTLVLKSADRKFTNSEHNIP